MTGDHITRFVADSGYALAVIRAPRTCSQIALDQHDLIGEPARVLGQAILAALLLATRLKGRGQLVMHLETDGALNAMRVDAIGLGKVRAMISPETHERLDLWNERQPLLGSGRLGVQRRLEGYQSDYTSQVAVCAEHMAAVANQFLIESEQVPAVVLADVRFADGPRSPIADATGLYLERLPDGDDPALDAWLETQRVAATPALATGDADDQALVDHFFGPGVFRPLHAYEVSFFCPCSRERFVGVLRGFQAGVLTQLTTDAGVIETTCDFCRTSYTIPLDEVI